MKLKFLVAAALLQGCVNTNHITGVVMGEMSRRPNPFCDGDSANDHRQCTPELVETLTFAELGRTIAAFPEGEGTCGFAFVDFGDGSVPSDFTNQVVDHRATWRAPHTYTGWPGKKTVRVKGTAGCYGEATHDISVGIGPDGRETFRSAFSPDTTRFCSDVRDAATQQVMPILRKGTGIRIETDGNTFNYGAPNQTFNASGDPSTLAPPGYPFPGLKKFSLVYRIGTQAVQGEAGPVIFVANQPGHLQVCVNDNPSYLFDNTGIMLVTITVNERSADLP